MTKESLDKHATDAVRRDLRMNVLQVISPAMRKLSSEQFCHSSTQETLELFLDKLKEICPLCTRPNFP